MNSQSSVSSLRSSAAPMSSAGGMAVFIIAEIVLMEPASEGYSSAALERVKRNVRCSSYWMEFCRQAACGRVPEDFAGQGILGRCVRDWAHEDGGNLRCWWNAMYHEDRALTLKRAAELMGRDPTISDAYELWKRGEL